MQNVETASQRAFSTIRAWPKQQSPLLKGEQSFALLMLLYIKKDVSLPLTLLHFVLYFVCARVFLFMFYLVFLHAFAAFCTHFYFKEVIITWICYDSHSLGGGGG